MPVLCFDSSAITRRYDPHEPGAQQVRGACSEPGNTVSLSELTSIEVASAIGRKVRDGVYDSARGSRAWALFQRDWRRQYQVIRLSASIARDAERIVMIHPLRAIDAIHVATALSHARLLNTQEVEFWTADVRQARAAEHEGLAVILIA